MNEHYKHGRFIHSSLIGISGAILLFVITPTDQTEALLRDASEAIASADLDDWISHTDREAQRTAESLAVDIGLETARILDGEMLDGVWNQPLSSMELPVGYRVPTESDSLAEIDASLSTVVVFEPDVSVLASTLKEHVGDPHDWIAIGTNDGLTKTNFPLHAPSNRASLPNTANNEGDQDAMSLVDELKRHLRKKIGFDEGVAHAPITAFAWLNVDDERVESPKGPVMIPGKVRVVQLDDMIRIGEVGDPVPDDFRLFKSRLSPIWDELHNKKLAAAQLYVQEQLRNHESTLTLMGFAVDGRSLSVVAPVLTLVIALHLVCHIRQIPGERERHGPFPWMLLFSDALGRLLSVVSLIVLPLVANTWLLLRVWAPERATWWIGAFGCLCILLVGVSNFCAALSLQRAILPEPNAPPAEADQ